jgi:hypothetical protein
LTRAGRIAGQRRLTYSRARRCGRSGTVDEELNHVGFDVEARHCTNEEIRQITVVRIDDSMTS